MNDDKLKWLINDSKGYKIKIYDDVYEIINTCKRNGEWNLVVEDFFESLMFIPFSYIKETEYEIID